MLTISDSSQGLASTPERVFHADFDPVNQIAATIERNDARFKLPKEQGVREDKRRLKALAKNHTVTRLYVRCLNFAECGATETVELSKCDGTWHVMYKGKNTELSLT